VSGALPANRVQGALGREKKGGRPDRGGDDKTTLGDEKGGTEKKGSRKEPGGGTNGSFAAKGLTRLYGEGEKRVLTRRGKAFGSSTLAFVQKSGPDVCAGIEKREPLGKEKTDLGSRPSKERSVGVCKGRHNPTCSTRTVPEDRLRGCRGPQKKGLEGEKGSHVPIHE